MVKPYLDNEYDANREDILLLIDELDHDDWNMCMEEVAKEAWLETEELSKSQLLSRSMTVMRDKLVRKIKWREQQNKLDNDE